jgi:hypothetical protein
MLINPKFPTASAEAREVQDAARALGTHINLLKASTESEIDAAFITIVEQRSGALHEGREPALVGCTPPFAAEPSNNEFFVFAVEKVPRGNAHDFLELIGSVPADYTPIFMNQT